MRNHNLAEAIDILRQRFEALNLPGTGYYPENSTELVYPWPGAANEDIMISVHKSSAKQEPFHRHEYFFFNYTYKGQYDSLSYKYDNRITIREKELYAGQPFAGHALCVHDNAETVIIGVLIRRETFYRAFLPMLSSNSRLLHFLLDPATNSFSDEFLHFRIEDDCNIRALLEMMVIEYAYRQPDTQDVLKPLVLAFLMQIARQYAQANPVPVCERLSDRIVQYMSEHSESVTLKDIAAHFSYHPNYVSTLLHRETGRSFSEILLEQRMERAVILLRGTDLPIAEVALMLGYSNSSNFFKAFREYYQMSPREYVSSAM